MQVAVEHLPRLNSLRNELVDLLRGIDGAGVEDNTFSVSVHYRNVSDQDVQRVFQCVDTVVSKYDHIRKGTGKKVVELKQVPCNLYMQSVRVTCACA
jgi:trehalose 6-phosphate phosphatase